MPLRGISVQPLSSASGPGTQAVVLRSLDRRRDGPALLPLELDPLLAAEQEAAGELPVRAPELDRALAVAVGDGGRELLEGVRERLVDGVAPALSARAQDLDQGEGEVGARPRLELAAV